MRFRVPDYKGKAGIISLSFDEKTKQDLLEDALDFWFVTEDQIIAYPERVIVSKDPELIHTILHGNNYDIYDIQEDGMGYCCYENGSVETTFFITAHCNSNCIMCPSSAYSRTKGTGFDFGKLMKIASHMPEDVPHITITGGEPFLAGKQIFELFAFMTKKFQRTDFLLLTNGRAFALEEYCRKLKETLPAQCLIGIPIHGSTETLHDHITMAEGSFRQMMMGIKRLVHLGLRVEVRIVVSWLNVGDLEALSDLIIKELSGVEIVTIMAMEMTGSAYINKDKVWIPYKEAFPSVKKAAMALIRAGIDTRFYNLPLCTVSKDLWTLCEKSISKNKVRFADQCDHCSMRTACGGLFAGTINLEKEELEPIK
ncbi:MAG: His-Xaa-Ser system radical SAM maturase HxsC [Lachnospiraceae bacterium]|nr:His-Xaa-Ser system radical SAM maturase HxsC [Lachnospiraceae bacterium]